MLTISSIASVFQKKTWEVKSPNNDWAPQFSHPFPGGKTNSFLMLFQQAKKFMSKWAQENRIAIRHN